MFDGKLKKLTILSFKDDQFELGGKPAGMYEAMFNPENFDVRHQVNYECAQAIGNSEKEQNYKNTSEKTQTFDFLVDATGAAGEKREVALDIEVFDRVTGYDGDKHQPRFLILIWGAFLMKGVLTSRTVKYTMFRDDGMPVRATITATFKTHTPNLVQALKNRLSSPDVTHMRRVKAGDNLPLLSNEIYGNPKHYVKVAADNLLSNLIDVRPGQELFFHPLEKTAS